MQTILDHYGLILERVAITGYRFDPDYLKVITQKKAPKTTQTAF